MNDFLNNIKFAKERMILKQIGEFADEIDIFAYVVGGYVRDILLGNPSKDIDIVVIGDGPDFALQFTQKYNLRKPAIFRRYGTAQFKIDDIEIEIVGARRESYTVESIKPEVEIGKLKDDIFRRDFTINTLTVPLNPSLSQNIIDITKNGINDLKNGIIKTPLDPTVTFSDDPSRILRAIRFASKYNFSIHKDTIKGIINNTQRLHSVPIEKVRDELNKILLYNNPSKYFNLMKKLGILRVVLPGLDLLFYIKQNPKYHKSNVGVHTLEVLKNIKEKNLITRLAALFHDYGKIDHTSISEKGEIIAYDHESSKLPEIAMRRLKYDNNTIANVVLIIKMHMRLSTLKIGSKGKRKFIRDCNGVLNEVLDLIVADKKSHIYDKELKNKFFALIDEIRHYDIKEIENILKIKSPLTGKDIIKLLNYPDAKTTKKWNHIYGVKIGQIKKLIVDSIIAQNIENTKEAATKFIFEQLPKEFLYPKVIDENKISRLYF
jgi:poly(A) polymerase